MRETDPATFEVVKNALYCAAEEMKVVLAKTAYSPLLKVAGDYSCGLFDVRGEMVAQGPDLPIHLGSMPLAVKAVIQASPTFEAGDVFIHNDPYFGGSHLPDVNVVTPAFHEGRLLGFACVRAHWPDIGSGTPGSYGASTEIYGEGLRLPPVRLYAAGVLNREVDAIIFTNVRTPEERRGDLRAQLAANHRGVTRLSELARRYGVERLLAIMQEVMDYSERMMRTLLAALPDGTADFEDFCDGDGVLENGDKDDQPFWIRMRVDKRGDRLIVDFAGTDRQVAGPMNAPLNVTASGIYCAIKMIADPAGPRPAQLGLLARHRAAGRAGDGGQRGVARAGGLRQPRDQPPRVRHAVRRHGPAGSRARDGVLAGDLGHPDARRRGRSDRRPLRLVRDDQGRLRRAAHQGRHHRRGQRHLEHHEHADRDPRDVLPGPRGALRHRPRHGRPRPLPRRLWRRARVADPRAALADERVPGADQVGAVRAGRWARGRAGPHRAGVRRRGRVPAPEQGIAHRAGGRRDPPAGSRRRRLRRSRGARPRAGRRRRGQRLRLAGARPRRTTGSAGRSAVRTARGSPERAAGRQGRAGHRRRRRSRPRLRPAPAGRGRARGHRGRGRCRPRAEAARRRRRGARRARRRRGLRRLRGDGRRGTRAGSARSTSWSTTRRCSPRSGPSRSTPSPRPSGTASWR